MLIWVTFVDRIISGIGISVRADAGSGRVPIIRRNEAGGDGVVVAGVEVLQPVRRATDSLDRLHFRLTVPRLGLIHNHSA
jgi:hypothetical protein